MELAPESGPTKVGVVGVVGVEVSGVEDKDEGTKDAEKREGGIADRIEGREGDCKEEGPGEERGVRREAGMRSPWIKVEKSAGKEGEEGVRGFFKTGEFVRAVAKPFANSSARDFEIPPISSFEVGTTWSDSVSETVDVAWVVFEFD